jgi:hypothetical protein
MNFIDCYQLNGEENMNKVIYAVMFCASAAVFAQPNDGESYYV